MEQELNGLSQVMPGQSEAIELESRPRQLRVIALAFLTALIDGLDLQIIAYAAPEIARDLRLEDRYLGLVFSAGFAGLAAGSMLVAPLGDRLGRRTIMIASLLMFGVCVLLTPLAQSPGQLLVLRLLTGIGLGGVMPNAIAIAMEFAPQRHRASMVSLTYFGFVIGAASGGILAALLIPVAGWKVLLYVVGTIPILLAAVEYWLLPESPQYLADRQRRGEPSRATPFPTSIIARSADFPDRPTFRAILSKGLRTNSILMWIAMFTNLSVAFGVIQWLPLILGRSGLDLSSANWLVGLIWLSAVPGVVILLWLAKRMPLVRVLSLVLAAGGVITLTLGIALETSATVSIWPFMIGFGMTLAGAQVGFYSVLTAVYPGLIRVTGIGLAQGIGRLGAIVGPAAIGFLLDSGVSLFNLFLYLAVPVFLSALAIWNVRPAGLETSARDEDIEAAI